jgi:Uma2 family endonuclease
MIAKPRKQQPSMTLAEYLTFEEASAERHEFVGGEVHAFAGGTDRHNLIAGKIYRKLADACDSAGCYAFIENVKLQVAQSFVYYPDVMVVCDPSNTDPLVKTDPCIVVEVLSNSTRPVDLREKLFAYHQIESLDAYLIVEQDERKVYRHWRDDERLWWSDTVSERGSIPIPRLGIELSLDDIYRKLPNPAPS